MALAGLTHVAASSWELGWVGKPKKTSLSCLGPRCWLSAEAPSFSTRWPFFPHGFISSRASSSRWIGWTSLQSDDWVPRGSIPSRQAPMIASCLLMSKSAIADWPKQVAFASPKSMCRELYKDVNTEGCGSLPWMWQFTTPPKAGLSFCLESSPPGFQIRSKSHSQPLYMYWERKGLAGCLLFQQFFTWWLSRSLLPASCTWSLSKAERTVYISLASFSCADLTTLVFSINQILSASSIFRFFWPIDAMISSFLGLIWIHSFDVSFHYFHEIWWRKAGFVCSSNTILNHKNKQKKFKVYSFCEKGKKVVRFLSLRVCTHTTGMLKRRGGSTRGQLCFLPVLRSWRCCHSSLFFLRNPGWCVNADSCDSSTCWVKDWALRSWLFRWSSSDSSFCS